ncbi:MAG: GNAT family N-acetyltransferase [Bacteroidales bacterium]|jgi:GNAT superfamily N-acetyltransferase|nr:GNAT family N-acetyltransferase [Bacteroidales bacterium]
MAVKSDIDILGDLWEGFENFFIYHENSNFKKEYKTQKEKYKKDILELNFSENPTRWTLVAEIDRNIVGQISWMKLYMANTPPVFHYRLSGIYVTQDYRNMGIGKKLFIELKEIAKKEKISAIKWGVWGKNETAKQFYNTIEGKYDHLENDEWSLHYTIV